MSTILKTAPILVDINENSPEVSEIAKTVGKTTDPETDQTIVALLKSIAIYLSHPLQ